MEIYMALTIRTQKRSVFGTCHVVFADVTFDNAYATGGESLVTADLGLPSSLTPQFIVAAPASGLSFEYDHGNKKLKANYPSGGTAPAALAAPSVRIPAGATTMTAATAAPTLTVNAGQGAEVASATDLSTVTTRVFAVVA
jgi:hypothetical protein